MRTLGLVPILIALTATDATFAGLITYTDRTAFLNAASAAALTTTNEAFAADPGDPFKVDDLNGNSVEFDRTSGFYGGFTNSLIASFGTPIVLESVSVSGSVVGVGFDFYYPNTSHQLSQSITLNGGTPVTNNGSAISFLGLLSTDGTQISSIDEIRLNSGLNSFAAHLDNLVIATGSTASAVPEPSTLAFLVCGALGLFGYIRKRKPASQAKSTVSQSGIVL